jgi:hypothetical protein
VDFCTVYQHIAFASVCSQCATVSVAVPLQPQDRRTRLLSKWKPSTASRDGPRQGHRAGSASHQ